MRDTWRYLRDPYLSLTVNLLPRRASLILLNYRQSVARDSALPLQKLHV